MLMSEGPSVQIEKKPQKVQPAPAEFVLSFEADRVRNFLAQATKTAPPETTQSAASNVIAAAELIAFLQKGKPKKDDPNLAIYNTALSTLAKDGKVESAINAAMTLHMRNINNLHALLVGGAKLVGNEAEIIDSHFKSINEDLDTGSRNFLKDESWRIAYMREKMQMTGVSNVHRTGEMDVLPSELDQAAEKVQLPPMNVSLQDILENLYPIQGISSLPILAYSPALSWTAISLFSTQVDDPNAQTNAQTGMNGLAASYAVLINSPNDAGAISRASTALYDAFNKIPPAKEIWSSSTFTTAMADLKAGKLKDGLDLMAGDKDLNSVYAALNNMYTLTISERALSVMKGGATFRYEFASKINAYDEYTKEGKKWAFLPLGIGMALYYETLDLVGQLAQLQTTVDANGNPVVTTQNTALSGRGQAVTMIPQATFGTQLWRKPVEFIVYCTVAYQKWEMGTQISLVDGTTQPLNVGQGGVYLGIYGIDANFSKAFGALEKPIFKIGQHPVGIERGGVANVGGQFNPIAYITFSSLMAEKNQWRVQLFAKPELRYLLRQFTTGLEIKPEATFQPEGKNVTFFGAPVFRFEWNYANSSYVYDMRAMLGARFLEGTQVYLDFARTGEVGAGIGKGMPGGWTMGLKADIAISSFFNKKEGKLGELKPSKK